MILAAGLSPAWQQIMRFDAFRAGAVNRAAEVRWCASGKVVNVAVALAQLGAPVEIITTVGGSTGDALQSEVTQMDIAGHWIGTQAATRVCTTIVDERNGTVTELIENTGPITAGELQRFQSEYLRNVGRARLVVFSGSLPEGAPATLIRDLLQATPCPAILDVRGEELLAALACRPLVVKPNRDELARTFGDSSGNEQDLRRTIAQLHERGAQWVVVTDGADPVRVSGPGRSCTLVPPKTKIVNPIGAGDCLAAAAAWGIFQGQHPVDALRLGMAAAADNVARLLPARLDRNACARLAATILPEDV